MRKGPHLWMDGRRVVRLIHVCCVVLGALGSAHAGQRGATEARTISGSPAYLAGAVIARGWDAPASVRGDARPRTRET